MLKHIGFPSIPAPAGALKDLQFKDVGLVDYIGTIKLDGSNLSVVCQEDGSLHFQSREMLLPIDGTADVYGFRGAFAKPEHLKRLQRAFAAVADFIRAKGMPNERPLFPITVYGEWAGQGVQGRTPVARLPLAWYPFAIRFSDFESDNSDKPIWTEFEFQQACVTRFVEAFELPTLVRSIFAYPTVALTVNSREPQQTLDAVELLVAPLESQCPFATLHGLEGAGEGWVFRPTGPLGINARYWFKAKTAAHEERRNRAQRELSPAQQAQQAVIDQLVQGNVNEARLMRAVRLLEERSVLVDKAATPDFLRALVADVIKDNLELIEQQGLDKKALFPAISKAGVVWFHRYVSRLV